MPKKNNNKQKLSIVHLLNDNIIRVTETYNRIDFTQQPNTKLVLEGKIQAYREILQLIKKGVINDKTN